MSPALRLERDRLPFDPILQDRRAEFVLTPTLRTVAAGSKGESSGAADDSQHRVVEDGHAFGFGEDTAGDH